jgi:hypothetical protein
MVHTQLGIHQTWANAQETNCALKKGHSAHCAAKPNAPTKERKRKAKRCTNKGARATRAQGNARRDESTKPEKEEGKSDA